MNTHEELTKLLMESYDKGVEDAKQAAIEVIQKAVLLEREACAKVCDDFERAKWESVKNISQNGGRLAFAGPMHCAAAIRARGQA